MNIRSVQMIKIIISCLLLCLAAPLPGEENLVKNPGMEKGTLLPSDWTQWAYNSNTTKFSLEKNDPHGEKQAMKIDSAGKNDARMTQWVTVKKNKTYRFSGWIKVEGTAREGKGANLTFNTFWDKTTPLYDTAGQWVYSEIVIKIGQGINKLEIACALGGYGGTSKGTAWFDDIKFEEIKSSLGIEPVLLQSLPTETKEKKSSDKGAPKPNRPKWRPSQPELTIFIVAILSALGALCILIFKRDRDPDLPGEEEVPGEPETTVIPSLSRVPMKKNPGDYDYSYIINLRKLTKLNYIRRKYLVNMTFHYAPGQVTKRSGLRRILAYRKKRSGR